MPIDLLVESPEARRNSRGLRCHVWGGDVPPGALVSLGEGVFLSTPEFVFLQQARALGLVDLALLGYEMCGAYACGSFGSTSASRCHPLTASSRLSRFIGMAEGAPGVKLARRAPRLFCDGSASAGETAMVFLAHAPRMLGGYGLPLPSMNHRLEVPAKMREVMGRDCFYLDAFWPDAGFDLEYDGERGHGSPDGASRDRQRASRLALLGVRAARMDRTVLFHAGRYNQQVRQTMCAIGYQAPTEDFDTAWYRRRDALREHALQVLFPEADKGRGA